MSVRFLVQPLVYFTALQNELVEGRRRAVSKQTELGLIVLNIHLHHTSVLVLKGAS